MTSPLCRSAIIISPVAAMTIYSWGAEDFFKKSSQLKITKNDYNFLMSISSDSDHSLWETFFFPVIPRSRQGLTRKAWECRGLRHKDLRHEGPTAKHIYLTGFCAFLRCSSYENKIFC